MYLTIFGTSDIVKEHIKSAKKNNFKIFGICTSREKKDLRKIKKKFQNIDVFFNIKACIEQSLLLKNCHFVIASSIKNNEKILKEVCKYDRKILIEKPVFLKSIQFNKFLKYKKKIFVGYNRIFYQNLNRIPKLLKTNKLKYGSIKIPEINRKNILSNSCHIISILMYFFGPLKINSIIKKKNYIFCILKNKNNKFFFLEFNFKSPENFSIELNFKNFKYVFKPIEELQIFNKVTKKKIRSINVYKPNLVKKLNEFHLSGNKPGFDIQYNNFKKFTSGRLTNFPDISFAKRIITLCEKII